MRKVKIGKHIVEMYDSIEDLPISRFHKYQKLLLIDSGIGGSIADFDKRIEKARRYLIDNKPNMAEIELQNMRQCFYMMQEEISPKHLAFVALIKTIDGKEYNEITDDSLKETMSILNDTRYGDLADLMDSVKKKIDSELTLYFPKAFDDWTSKDFYEKVRKRTLLILENIANGIEAPDKADNVERITTEMLTYGGSNTFIGADSTEIQYDRQFENLCLSISHELNVNPKQFTVLEFYNAFEYLKEKAKAEREAAKKARKRG